MRLACIAFNVDYYRYIAVLSDLVTLDLLGFTAARADKITNYQINQLFSREDLHR